MLCIACSSGTVINRPVVPASTQIATIPLLPGQQIWKNGVSSSLFGTNDTQSWDLQDNIETDPYHIIQPSLKSAHFTLMRSFFFAHSLYDGHQTTDDELDQRIRTIQQSGMTCLGVLQDIKTDYGIRFAKHVVAYLGSKCNMYEIGNEPDAAGIPVEIYLQVWKSLVPQLRALNPDAKFGGPVSYNYQGNNCTYTNGQAYCYMRKFLQGAKASGVLPDFTTFHWYPCWNDTKASCLAKAATYATVTQEVKGWVASDLGKRVPVGITEWNMDPGSNHMLGDDPAFMYQFTRQALSAMIQAKLDFANQFDAQNAGGYGALDMFDVTNKDQPKAQFNAIRDLIKQYYPGTTLLTRRAGENPVNMMALATLVAGSPWLEPRRQLRKVEHHA